jgi:outer membrane murein-binding lipoprotein Lpp
MECPTSVDEAKLTELAKEVQSLTSKYWELRAEMTEMQARMQTISEIFEQKYDRLGGH